MSLSDFIIAEGLRTRSVLSLHRFDTLFKHQVTKDLQQALHARWKAEVKRLKLKPNFDVVEDTLFKNPKAVVEPVVSDRPVKLVSSTEHGLARQASPSVKLPLILPPHDLAIARDAMLDAASVCFTEVLNGWSEVFMHELPSGKITTDFKVKRDGRTVRLCLVSTERSVEHEIVLYHVAIEHGKIGSKIRDHDTIYLSVDR